MFVNVNIYVCQSSPYFEALFDLLIAFNHTILGQVHSLEGGGIDYKRENAILDG